MAQMITIRRGRPQDLAAVQSLNQALFQHEHDQGFYSGERFNLNWPYEQAGINYFVSCLSDSPSSAVFVAEDKGQVVGYLAAAYAAKAFRAQNPIGELENMYVEEPYRRQGVGMQLVNAFKDWARQNHVAYIRVGAYAANHLALAFYRKCGFTDLETHMEQKVDL
jgi:GNAT superfamily N-acetyltransferase